MEFFNIGGLELLFILIIALVALGPDRIVEVGRKLGGWMRKLSKNVLFREVMQTTDEIRNYPRKILDEANLDVDELGFSKRIKVELYGDPSEDNAEQAKEKSFGLDECSQSEEMQGPERPVGP